MENIETMSEELFHCLVKAGVKQDVLDSLIEDELYTVELLQSTSDTLLKQCGLKVGQIVRLRNGIEAYKDNDQISTLIQSPTTSSSNQFTNPRTPSLCDALPSRQTPLYCGSYESPSPRNSRPPSPLSNCSEESPIASLAGSHIVPQCKEGKWLQLFKLPSKFSPGVYADLEAKKMSSSNRNEFTRDICSSIMVYTLFPTKLEREHVALMIIKKYPFLEDKMGSGIVSWEQAMKHRFKNIRKTKPTAVKRLTQSAEDNIKPKKVTKLEVGSIPELPEGETGNTCKEHVIIIKKEMAKPTNRNMRVIKQLMDITFAIRRKSVLLEPTAIDNILKEYPALALVSELKAEFARVMGDNNIIKNMETVFKDTLKSKILNLAKKKNSTKNVIQDMEDGILIKDDRKAEIEEIAAITALTILLKDRCSTDAELLKICSEDESIDDSIEKSLVPKLVGSGDMSSLTCLYVVGEGKIICKLNPMVSPIQALAVLLGCYYIFNIEYPSSTKNVFLFLEATLMDRPREAKKRVVINKFMQELN